jgi:hypothetical protein
VIGLPTTAILRVRIEAFLINIITIGAAAVVSYALLGLRREELRRIISPRRSFKEGH